MVQKGSMDVSFVREFNQRSVLKRIYEKGKTSRAELARELSMSKPAISDNLAHPLKIGLIRETGENLQLQSGGRPPVMLEFNENHRYIIAIDLNYSQPVFVLGNLRGEIIRKFEIRISRTASPESYLSVIEDGINILIASTDMARENLFAIALALPGAYDDEGKLRSENKYYAGIRWSTIGLYDVLRKKFGVEVILKNDTKAATLGEWIDGAGKGADSLIYISAGIGLGSGIVLNSRLLEGAHFTAGEIYDHYASMDNMSTGETLEHMVSMKSLTDRYMANLPEEKRIEISGDEWKGFEVLVKDYRAGNPTAYKLVEDACRAILMVVRDCVNILDLDRIVFGGEYAVFGDAFIQCFNQYFLSHCRHQPEVLIAQLDHYSGIHGLFYLARERYFDVVCSHNGADERDSALCRENVKKRGGGEASNHSLAANTIRREQPTTHGDS